jgi:hypothetical protein
LIVLAKKTLAAIDAAIELDQGASYRQHLKRVLPHMADAYRGAEENPFRSHLGASILGGKCGRAIWYSFHWFTKPKFPGRVLRLFNRGHLEEARLIAALLTINCRVYQQDGEGRQYRISDVAGHLGGSGDGVAIGIPDLPVGAPALTEWKTHNDASFKALVKTGVREAKFEHFVQMQTYMRKMGLMYGLYGAVNKNDDSIHLEIITLDTGIGDQFLQRGRTIIMMARAPAKINESPGWFDCKWCDHRPVCHLKATPERNCRTCIYVECNADKGGWDCGNKYRQMAMVHGEEMEPDESPKMLTEKRQLMACKRYEPIL